MIEAICEAPAKTNEIRTPDAVEVLGERIALLSAQISAATYELLSMLREFDERGGWNCGFHSCAHWLNWRAGIDLGAAREKVRVARALAGLPCLSESMRRGELSYAKLRALTRIATLANEAELLTFARAGTAAHVERLVRGMRSVDRNEEREHEQRRHACRYLRLHTDEDGMVVISARLPPEAGATLLRAIEAGLETLYGRARREEAHEAAIDGPTAEQRRADALGLVAESALSGGLDPGTRGDRYQVVVHVDAAALSAAGDGATTLADGTYVSAETSRRLACDAAVVTMRHAPDGSVLDVGRRTRAISPALRRALDHRDRGCRFPGCGLRLCDAHHVEHWADGGATKLGNTLLLCRRHHRAVHEEGFRVELRASGEARFYRPDGRPLVDALRLSVGAGGAENGLTPRLATRGVVVAAKSTLPSWDGGEVDYGWEIDWLRSLDRGRPAPTALPS